MERVISESGLYALYAAMCRLALRDYADGYHAARHPEAAAFLRAAGLLRPDGRLDWHGYQAGRRTGHYQGVLTMADPPTDPKLDDLRTAARKAWSGDDASFERAWTAQLLPAWQQAQRHLPTTPAPTSPTIKL